MIVQFNVRDFLDRAEAAYPDRVGLIDEPEQPAEPWGPLTFADWPRRARAQAAGLDRLGVAPGERVAIVSHNSSRLLTSFFGVCGWGRILVPINFRLAPAEVEYIVEHSGASVLLVDPELEADLSGIEVAPPLRARGRDATPCSSPIDGGTEPRPWASDEQATATINYTSGTTARPKGVQLTHRNCWVNAAIFGWHIQLSDQDVYLHTLPMFHANGWGMPWATTAMGCTQVVAAQGGRHRDPAPGGAARGQPAVRGPGGGQRRPRRRCPTGTGPSPGGTAPGSWWPAPRRPAGPSSGSSPSSAGSSSRSTA